MSIEAMKQARDALEGMSYVLDYNGKQVSVDVEIAALRTAIAEAEKQEPVAEVKAMETGGNAGLATVIREIYSPFREALRPGEKLYTTPPAAQRQPLTDERLLEIIVRLDPETKRLPPGFRLFTRAIEAAHDIK